MLTNLTSLGEMWFQGPRREPETTIPCPPLGAGAAAWKGSKRTELHLSQTNLGCLVPVYQVVNPSPVRKPFRCVHVYHDWAEQPRADSLMSVFRTTWLREGDSSCRRFSEQKKIKKKLRGAPQFGVIEMPASWGRAGGRVRAGQQRVCPVARGARALRSSRCRKIKAQTSPCHLFFTTPTWLPACLHSGWVHLAASTVSV